MTALPDQNPRTPAGSPLPWRLILSLLLLFAAALAVRLWQLVQMPPGLYLDEAAYGLDAQGVLQGAHALFFPRNNGREPFFIYLLALVFSLLGDTPWTIRLTAAVCGALTVPAVWWLVYEVSAFARAAQAGSAGAAQAGGARSPLWHANWVAALLAFSYWHLALSRLGFRAITFPLLATLGFALLWRSWRMIQTSTAGAPARTDRAAHFWALAAGVTLGASLYTYTAARFTLVLWALLCAVAWLLASEWRFNRKQLLRSAALTGGSALLVALPLLWYFVVHWQEVSAHAAYLSIFNPNFSGGNPLAALWRSISQTGLMLLGFAADPNARHNPAARPAIEWFLGVWLALGVLLGVRWWRRPQWCFGLAWLLVFLAPVVLSAEGIPHSLRAIGLLPGLLLLIVLALETAGAWLARRIGGASGAWIAHWLPLPFVVAAAIVGSNAYFTALEQHATVLRRAFFVDYVTLAHALDTDAARTDLWLLPLPPGEDLGDDSLTTVDFLLHTPAHVRTLRLGNADTTTALAEAVADFGSVHVLTTYGVPVLTDYDTRFMDIKGALDLQLRANGAILDPVEGEIAGFPYRTYHLPADASFALAREEAPVQRTFSTGGTPVLELIGVRSTAEDGRIVASADAPLWAILRWRALQPVGEGLKSSIVLRHVASGRVVAQVDSPLTSDRFPRQPTWLIDEEAHSYALLAPMAGTPPGAYQLEVTVYDEAEGASFQTATAAGEPLHTLPLLQVSLQPVNAPAAATHPDYPLEALLAPALALTGIDALPATLAPGSILPLTLHLRALEAISRTTPLSVTLQNGEGVVVAQTQVLPGGDPLATSEWRVGEHRRVWADLALPADLPSGAYAVMIDTHSALSPAAPVKLGEVQVAGRARLLTAPAIALPLAATYADSVRLLGSTGAAGLAAQASASARFNLVWQPLQTDARDLVRFVQLLDAGGAVIAQQDTVACEGACPASSWIAGEYLVDAVALGIPAETSPGLYDLLVGWYDRATGTRLAARDAEGAPLPDDVLRLPFQVEAAE